MTPEFRQEHCTSMPRMVSLIAANCRSCDSLAVVEFTQFEFLLGEGATLMTKWL
jgi:hypothetical protein